MSNQHTLSRSSVKTYARSGALGVYKLFRSRGGPVRYVGRSGDVQRRLLEWARDSNYATFSVEYYDDLRETWRREVNLFHYHEDALDNEIHPRAPEGMTCHRCSRV